MSSAPTPSVAQFAILTLVCKDENKYFFHVLKFQGILQDGLLYVINHKAAMFFFELGSQTKSSPKLSEKT